MLLPIACVLVGALAIAGAVRAYDASDATADDLGPVPPDLAAEIAGPYSWRRDPPRFWRLDDDHVFVDTGRGHGMLTRRAGAVVFTDLGDVAPRPDGWWARQVFDSGVHLGGAGVLLILFAWFLLMLGWPLTRVIEARR